MTQVNIDTSRAITMRRIGELGQFQDSPCVSIYTPVVTAGPQTRQNEIRISNQFKQASDRFMAFGLDKDDAEKAASPLNELKAQVVRPDGERFSGIVTFLKPEHHESIAVPGSVEEKVIAGPRFVTRYLLPFVNHPASVFVLALSRGEARFYEVTRNSEERLRPEGMPESFAEFTAWEDPEQSIQHHGTPDASIFHGHGGAKDTAEGQLEQNYIRQVTVAIDKYLAENQAPLLLATTRELAGEFAQYIGSSNLHSQLISGNVEHLSQSQIRDRAWSIVDESLGKDDQDAALRFRELCAAASKRDDVVTGVQQIIWNAYQGLVSELAFPHHLNTYGTFDTTTGTTFINSAAEASAGPGEDGKMVDDLVDLAASVAIQHGAPVRTIPGPDGPDDDLPLEMVAVLRTQ